MARKIEIDDDIKNAIAAWLKDHEGNQSELARRVGCTSQAVNQWVGGAVKGIGADNWPAVLCEIRRYMPYDHPATDPAKTREEQLLLKLFRAMAPAARQDTLLNVMERAVPIL